MNYTSISTNMQTINATTKNGVCKAFVHNKCTRGNQCPFPHMKSKIRPCNNFQMGNCQFGDNCDFSHQNQRICQYYQKGQCSKGNSCKFKHVFKSCLSFDMGFCPLGDNCKRKHINRKLCQDYMLGFCSKGPSCKKAHPKVFNQTDFQFTKIFFDQNKKPFTLFTCFDCKLIGHKSPSCPQRKQLSPSQQFECILCDKMHSLDYICPYKQ